MTKNVKVTEKVKDYNIGQVSEQVTKVEMEGILSGVRVKRESFTTARSSVNNFIYYKYFVSGQVLRGDGVVKDIRANMAPQDRGGYGVLDLIFDANDSAELYMIPYTVIDEKTKVKISGYTYEAANVIDGIVYRLKLRPDRPSDKAYLDIILQKAKIEREQLLHKQNELDEKNALSQ